MGSPRQPLRTSPDGSQASRDAALSGANLAFIKSLPPREALAYLNKHSPPPAPKEKHQQNVRSTSSYSLARHDGPVSTRTSPDHLRLPKRPPHKTTPSASSLTATIAAARAAPNLVNASTRPPSKPPVRAAGNLAPPTAPKRKSPDKLDLTPIPSTSSLVELFEPKEKRPPPAIKSPKPLRKTLLLRNQTLEPITTRLEQTYNESSGDEAYESARDYLSPDKPHKPILPPARRSVQRTDSKVHDLAEPSIHVQPPSRAISTRGTTRSPPRRSLSPDPSHLSISTTKLRPIVARNYSPNHLTDPDHPSITAVYHQLHPRRMTPLKSGDSLANAIVASSLASSRAPSPTKLPPHSLPSRRTSHTKLFTRTPSPKKGMRHTMRKPASDSDSDQTQEEEMDKEASQQTPRGRQKTLARRCYSI
jgi:hypothetical protein